MDPDDGLDVNGSAWEAVAAEYAAIEARLADPRVHRDFRLARRLRRSREALRPLNETASRLRALLTDLRDARDLAAEPGWRAEADRIEREAASVRAALDTALDVRDPYDPYDVIVLIDAVSDEGDGVQSITDAFRREARERGWRAEHLYKDPPPYWTVLGITAGEEGPGAWAVLKDAAGSDVVHVTVLPEDEPTDADPAEFRLNLVCTREPSSWSTLGVVHIPTGIGMYMRDSSGIRAKVRAMRVVLAQLAMLERAPEGRYQAVPQRPGGHLWLRAAPGRPSM